MGVMLLMRCWASGCVYITRQTHWTKIGLARAIRSPIFPLPCPTRHDWRVTEFDFGPVQACWDEIGTGEPREDD